MNVTQNHKVQFHISGAVELISGHVPMIALETDIETASGDILVIPNSP